MASGASAAIGGAEDLITAYLNSGGNPVEIDLEEPIRGGIIFDGQTFPAATTIFGVRGLAGILGFEIQRDRGIVRGPQSFEGPLQATREVQYDTDLTLRENTPGMDAAFRFQQSGGAPQLEVFPEGVTKTGLGDIIALESDIDVDFAGGTMSSLVRFGSTVSFLQNANPFGMGPLFNAAGVFQNDPSAASNLGTALSFVGQNTYRANAQAITMAGVMRSHISQEKLDAISGGTASLGQMTHFFVGGNIETGWTVTTRRGVHLLGLGVNTGTLTNNYGLHIENHDDGSNNIGVLIEMDTGDGDAIETRGDARCLFGGEVEIDGDLNHDGANAGFRAVAPVALSPAYSITNVVTDRSYDANATDILEIADVLGTVVADLQAQGLLG